MPALRIIMDGPTLPDSGFAHAESATVGLSALSPANSIKPRAGASLIMANSRVPSISTGSGLTGLPNTAITPMAYTAQPAQAAPGYLATTIHPLYGTEVTRVSNANQVRHRYSSKPAWSCNEAYMLLDHSGTRQLLNGMTLQVIASGIDTGGSCTWSSTDPSLAYAYGFTSSIPRIRRYRASPTSWTLESQVTIVGMSGGGTVHSAVMGGNYGVPDRSDRWLPLVLRWTDNWHGVGIWDTQNNVMAAQRKLVLGPALGQPLSGVSEQIGYCSMSPDGNYLVYSTSLSSGGTGTAINQGAWGLYFGQGADPTLSGQRQYTTDAGHMDTTQLANGTQVLCMVSQSATGGGSSGNYGFYNIATGAWTRCGGGSGSLALSNAHVGTPKGVNAVNGIAMLSSHNTSSTNFPGKSEMFYMDLENPTRHIRMCHTHITSSTAYADETQACPSPSATRGVFASNWDNNGFLYSYVAGLDVIRPSII